MQDASGDMNPVRRLWIVTTLLLIIADTFTQIIYGCFLTLTPPFVVSIGRYQAAVRAHAIWNHLECTVF